MKIVYKPFALIARFGGVWLGKTVFKGVWSRIDDGDPPTASTEGASFGKVLFASALQGATMTTSAAIVNRLSARWFKFVTGVWPGEPPQDEASGLANGRGAHAQSGKSPARR